MSKLQLKTPAFAKASAGKQNFIILAVLFLLPAYLIKIKFGWMSFNILELLITILFLVWLFNKDNKYTILNTKYSIPTLLIFFGLILSTLANKNFYSGFGAIKGWFLFPIIFGAIFYDALKKGDGLLKKSLLALFFSGFVVSAAGIVYELLGLLTYDNRLKIFWDSPNQLAMFLAVPFLIGMNFSISSSEFRTLPKPGFVIGSILVAINLFFTQSFGAWLAIAAALLVYLYLKYGKIWQRKYLAIIVIIIALIIGWASFAKFQDSKNIGNRSSFASRIMIWKSASLMIENNPLFGIGPGNFQQKYLEYQKYFPPYLEWSAPQPHNIFLAFWLESGLIGLAGFVWILYLFFRDNKTAIRNNRSLGLLFLAIMLYILIHGLVDTTYWRNDLAVVFWMVIAANLYIAIYQPESPLS